MKSYIAALLFTIFSILSMSPIQSVSASFCEPRTDFICIGITDAAPTRDGIEAQENGIEEQENIEQLEIEYDIAEEPAKEVGIIPADNTASLETEDSVTEIDEQGAYTNADAVALAKMLWGEARGCTYDDKRNCCITVCNRVEEGCWYGSTVIECVTAFYGTDDQQYHGYSPNNPVIDELYQIALGVLNDWETHTNWNNYNCFYGKDGSNHFYIG